MLMCTNSLLTASVVTSREKQSGYNNKLGSQEMTMLSGQQAHQHGCRTIIVIIL